MKQKHTLYIAPTASNFRLACDNRHLQEQVDLLYKICLLLGGCLVVAVMVSIW